MYAIIALTCCGDMFTRSVGGLLSTKNLTKVLERMGITENTTLNVRREEGGKIRVTSNLWDFEKVILKGEVLEVIG